MREEHLMAEFDQPINKQTPILQPLVVSQVHKQVHKSKPAKKRKKKVKDNKLVLTQGFIERLEKPKRRQKFWDSKVNGLLLEVMTSGAKIFRFRKTVKQQIQTSTIGSFANISLEEARDAAIRIAAKIADGASFTSERQALREELTLQELTELYFSLHAKGRCETIDEMRSDVYRWWAKELPLKLSALNAMILQSRIDRLSSNGAHVHRANKARDHIRAILTWGTKRKQLKENPALELEGFTTQARQRVIDPEEYAPLMRAMSRYPDKRLRDFFYLCLYTGARSGKVMSMRWEDINFGSQTWLIAKDKNGDPNYVPLSNAALSILTERYRQRGAIQWVFPGGQSHKPTTSHLKEPKGAWAKILEWAAEETPSIADLRIHDLRRTMGSYAAMSDSSTATVQKLLGHKSIQAAAIYQRVNNSAAKVAADKALTLLRTMSDTNTANSEVKFIG
jgi:integrase